MPTVSQTLERLRDHFQPGPEPDRWNTLLRFVKLSAAKAGRDALPIQSAALAFITVLSLVPLLASLVHFSAGFFANRQGELVNLLARVLPYTAVAINEQLHEFITGSEALRGFGLVAFMVTALTAFSSIESTINDIWDVPHRRSLRSRLASFIMLIAWGPLLIGATYSGLFVLRQQPTFELIAIIIPPFLISFTATFVGLTMLNWQVPYTKVEFRYALLGGASSAVLLELLQFGFGIYAERVPQMSLVYGSFGFALLFMISIQLSWAIILLGTEIAYCAQNFKAMSRTPRDLAVIEGSWMALAALAHVVDRFTRHHPITPHKQLASRLGITVEQLHRLLQPVLDADLLQEIRGPSDGYILASDPHRTTLDDIFQLYEPEQRDLVGDVPEEARGVLDDLRVRFADVRRSATADLTLADLVAAEEDAAVPEPAPKRDDGDGDDD